MKTGTIKILLVKIKQILYFPGEMRYHLKKKKKGRIKNLNLNIPHPAPTVKIL